MPTAIILAGPNGAGKTTFANEYLRNSREPFVYLNNDEVARELSHLSSLRARDLQAGRLLLARLEKTVADRANFLVETTLASKLYARHIAGWRLAGYRVALIYLRLPDVEASLDRVRRRVSLGGHDVPADDIMRRFERSLSNLDLVYKPLVDEWQILENQDNPSAPAESNEP